MHAHTIKSLLTKHMYGLLAVITLLVLTVPLVSLAQTYSYVNTSGTISSVEANSPAEVYTRADIAPHSGVIIASNLATAGTVGTGGTSDIAIMSHICNSDIENRADFDAIDSFVGKVLACPTVILPGDDYSPGAVATDNEELNFAVIGGDANTTLIADAEFNQTKICETDIDQDANGDGDIDSDTCLDTSHYIYEDIAMGHVSIAETMAPEGTHFGALEFTPDALMPNEDSDTLNYLGDEGNGIITLNTNFDDNDSLTLHIYNFLND